MKRGEGEGGGERGGIANQRERSAGEVGGRGDEQRGCNAEDC